VFKCKFFELHNLEIYTDGSKDGVRTVAVVVAPNSVKTVRPPVNASIFTAEIYALHMATHSLTHSHNPFPFFR